MKLLCGHRVSRGIHRRGAPSLIFGNTNDLARGRNSPRLVGDKTTYTTEVWHGSPKMRLVFWVLRLTLFFVFLWVFIRRFCLNEAELEQYYPSDSRFLQNFGPQTPTVTIVIVFQELFQTSGVKLVFKGWHDECLLQNWSSNWSSKYLNKKLWAYVFWISSCYTIEN